jgi:hypothetical protein
VSWKNWCVNQGKNWCVNRGKLVNHVTSYIVVTDIKYALPLQKNECLDPYLGYTMVGPVIKGIQANGVVANAKHWVNNNQVLILLELCCFAQFEPNSPPIRCRRRSVQVWWRMSMRGPSSRCTTLLSKAPLMVCLFVSF